MGRDTLRELEDLKLQLETSLRCDRIVCSTNTAIYLTNLIIDQEKRLREVEKVLDKR